MQAFGSNGLSSTTKQNVMLSDIADMEVFKHSRRELLELSSI